MPDVFISHVEEDSAIALEMADALQAAAYSTWCYEIDSTPGVSYLVQTSRAIEESRAVIVLISRHSLGSFQVTKEVVRAHETDKPFIPVLISISRAEFIARQPEWREAIGSATTISLPEDGVDQIMPRILGGLEALGIEPRPADGEPAARDRSGRKKLVAAALAVALVGVVATAALALRGGDGGEESAATDKTTEPADDPAAGEATTTTGFGEAEPAEEEILDSATAPIETSAGPVRVAQARLLSEVCPPPGGIEAPCRTAPGGTRILTVDLADWNGGDLFIEAVSSEVPSASVSFGGTRLEGADIQLLPEQTPVGVRLVFAGALPASAEGQDVTLHWPGRPPMVLHPTV